MRLISASVDSARPAPQPGSMLPISIEFTFLNGRLRAFPNLCQPDAMKRSLIFQALFLAASVHTAFAINPPTGLVIASGDKSVILHWDPNAETNVAGYNVYRSLSSLGPFTVKNSGLLTVLGFCDLSVTDGQTNYYQITAVTTTSQESSRSVTVSTPYKRHESRPAG